MGQSSSSSEEEQPDFKKYGSIMAVSTSGASQRTANQDNLDYKGVSASNTMAKTDSGRMREYRSIIETVGRRYDVDPALIAAIISRESRAGNTIRANDGWGDWSPPRHAYNAFGLMQVDVNPDGGAHDPEGEWDSEDHVDQGTRILVHFIKKIQKKFPNWCKEQQLKGGIAAYNMGDGNVHSYNNVDENTTGEDYSNDVVARAKWYKNYGDF